MAKKRIIETASAFMVMAAVLTGCGEGTSQMATMPADKGMTFNNTVSQDYYSSDSYGFYGDMMDGAEYDTEEYDETAMGNTDIEPVLLEEKLVYRCNISMETLDYPATIASVRDSIKQYGGIIQSESENDSGYGWYYRDYMKTNATMHNYMEVRIPSENYEAFLSGLCDTGKIICKTTGIDNISQRYYDTTSQIESLKIQEANLLGMMEKCETIEDMITVEKRLSEVQYELSELQTSKTYMDMDVAYSYVNISIEEVMEYRQDGPVIKKNTFIDRLKNTVRDTCSGFVEFLENLLFMAIRIIPYVAVAAIAYFAFAGKMIKNFIKKKKEGSHASDSGDTADELPKRKWLKRKK